MGGSRFAATVTAEDPVTRLLANRLSMKQVDEITSKNFSRLTLSLN